MPANYKSISPNTPPVEKRVRWGVWAYHDHDPDGFYFIAATRVKKCEVFYKRKVDDGYLLRYVRKDGKWTWPYIDYDVGAFFDKEKEAQDYSVALFGRIRPSSAKAPKIGQRLGHEDKRQ